MGVVRAGPPFPYLRWTGPLFTPAASIERGTQIVRQRSRSRRAGAPVTGCGNASRAACRNWRPQPVPAGRAVLGVTGDRMADREQVRADLVRAAGLQPHAQQGVVRERALDLEVRDRLWRVSSVSVEMRVRTRRSRPSGASMVPWRSGGRFSTSARYSRIDVALVPAPP